MTQYFDGVNRSINIGDKVRFRNHIYTIKRFLPGAGVHGSAAIEFDEPQHTAEVADEISVDLVDDETLDFGPCCACEKTGPDVRNTLMLHRLCPTPGKGWGCVQCGLPMNYASAVLCDTCVDGPSDDAPMAEIKFVCTGYPASDGRTPIEQTPEVKVKHNPLYHPEMIQAMKFFDTSPDYGHPECICSICGDHIPDPEDEMDSATANRFIPLRLYREPSQAHPHGQEARFCIDCGPAVLKYSKLN